MSEVHVRDHDILLEVLPPTEVFPPGPDRLRPSLEDDVHPRSDEVRVQDEERVLDRARGQDLVEERLARRRGGADDRERIGPPERVRLPELREERSIADHQPELPEVRLREHGLGAAAEVQPLPEGPEVRGVDLPIPPHFPVRRYEDARVEQIAPLRVSFRETDEQMAPVLRRDFRKAVRGGARNRLRKAGEPVPGHVPRQEELPEHHEVRPRLRDGFLDPPQVRLLVEERRRELREGDPHVFPFFARARPASRARSFSTRIPHVERNRPNPRNGSRTRNRTWICGMYVRNRTPAPARITPIAAQYCQGLAMSTRGAMRPHVWHASRS